MNPIYLDHNATTPIAPEVADAMADCYRAGYANPASQHAPGRRARRVLEEAREGVAAILGAEVGTSCADRVIFTSGGTEANNLAVRGLARGARAGKAPGKIIISAIEHPSVAASAEYLTRHGWELARICVSAECVADVGHFARLLDDRTQLVSVMLASNETGVLQPVREMAAMCREAGVPMHTDAVQVAGKLPVDFRNLGVSAMTVSAHKFHGPRGVGALLVRHGEPIEPVLFGGFQQARLRPGTEAVVPAVGMHKALELWQRESDRRSARMAQLRVRLERLLEAELPGVVVNGAGAARLPQTTNVSFPGVDRQKLLVALDQVGIACSTGSACASGASEPSPVLLAMGCSTVVVDGSLRLSLGATTTAEEIEEAARRIVRVVKNLQSGRPHGKSAVPSRQGGPRSL